jgi:hypothetical protein
MKFIQFQVIDWTDGKGRGYTILALGEDGVVYKSIPKFPGPQHVGWLPLDSTVLPADAKIERAKPLHTPMPKGKESTPEQIAAHDHHLQEVRKAEGPLVLSRERRAPQAKHLPGLPRDDGEPAHQSGRSHHQLARFKRHLFRRGTGALGE